MRKYIKQKKENIIIFKFAILLLLSSFFFAFQNCSEVEYSSSFKSLAVVNNYSISINSGSAFTDSEKVNLSLKADGAVEIYITEDPTCETGGEWQPYQSSKEHDLNVANLNGVAEIFAKFRSIDDVETPCVSDSIVHDSIPPRVDWFNRPMQSGVFSASSYNVEFDLMERGSGVRKILCKVDNKLIDCADARSIKVQGAEKGVHQVRVIAFDHAGNKTEEDISWAVVPKIGLVSFNINGGKDYTQKTNVKLNFVAENATKMKISEDSSCKTGAVENFLVSKDHTLKNKNKINRVYAQFYNEAGDKSPCVLASIVHDDIAPVIDLDNAPGTNSLLLKDLATGSLNIIENGSGVDSYKCSLDSKTINCSTGAGVNSILSEGDYILRIKAIDRAGNSATHTYKFDRLFPLGRPSIAIKQSPYTNDENALVDLLLEAENAKEVFISNEANCSVGSWEYVRDEKQWQLKALNAENVVYAKFRNTNALVSDCVNASVIHDNIPYVISLKNEKAVYELTDRLNRDVFYTIKDNGKNISSFKEVGSFEGCFAEEEESKQRFQLNCDEFGKISLESLEPGSYNLSISFLDPAKNLALLEHPFKLIENFYLCDDPLYRLKRSTKKCLALYDDFERAEVDGESQFNWHTLIDDVIREDSVNVQANIFKNGQLGFGEAAHGQSAAFFTGRLGGSVHEIFMISKPLDLSDFSNFEILFNYLPVNLEEYSWKGNEGIEHIRIDICTSSERDCGLDESRSYDNRVKALKSDSWKSIYVQDGYEGGNLTKKEKGVNNTGRNHTKDTWLEGRVELNLDSSLIYDQSKVTVRVTILLDEGFSKADKKRNPYFDSELEDAIGIDNFRFFAGY